MANEVTIAAVGDIMLGDSPQVFGYGVGSQIRKHGVLHPFAHVRERLRSVDIAMGNLEVVVSRFDPARTAFADRVYRGQPEAIDGVADAGFHVLSVCTNHMMQHGQAVLDEMLDLLKRAGIEAIGAKRTGGATPAVARFARNGLRLVFLAYNFRPQQYFVAPPAWPSPDFETIRRDVSEHRANADVVVVSLHWGDEFISEPAPEQIVLARRLIDAGVDVIVGHHPHILQGVERYHGGVIAYSLGNFVYDQWQERLRHSAILCLRIRGPRDIDCEVVPVLINDRHQPVPVTGAALPRATAELDALRDAIGRSTEAAYAAKLEAENRRFRREIYVHYATKFWRSHPADFLANLAGIVKRRM